MPHQCASKAFQGGDKEFISKGKNQATIYKFMAYAVGSILGDENLRHLQLEREVLLDRMRRYIIKGRMRKYHD